MSWTPFFVLLGSALFPAVYYLSSSDRTETGLTGSISVIVPIVGLVLGVILLVTNLGSLIASPLQLFLTLGSVGSVLMVISLLIPRIIGATIVELVFQRL